MSDIIQEAPKALKMKTILSFDMDEEGGTQVHINTKSELFLALALRRMGQVVDLYLADQEMKRQEEKLTVAPASVLDMLRT